MSGNCLPSHIIPLDPTGTRQVRQSGARVVRPSVRLFMPLWGEGHPKGRQEMGYISVFFFFFFFTTNNPTTHKSYLTAPCNSEIPLTISPDGLDRRTDRQTPIKRACAAPVLAGVWTHQTTHKNAAPAILTQARHGLLWAYKRWEVIWGNHESPRPTAAAQTTGEWIISCSMRRYDTALPEVAIRAGQA